MYNTNNEGLRQDLSLIRDVNADIGTHPFSSGALFSVTANCYRSIHLLSVLTKDCERCYFTGLSFFCKDTSPSPLKTIPVACDVDEDEQCFILRTKENEFINFDIQIRSFFPLIDALYSEVIGEVIG